MAHLLDHTTSIVSAFGSGQKNAMTLSNAVESVTVVDGGQRMPGARQADFRLGDRTELLVEFCLNAIAFTTAVPRQEDVGHDFVCALAEPHQDMLWAGPSFTVQAKSNTNALTFQKEHEIAWIRNQENPFFVAVGHKADLRVDFYSTWQRVSAALQRATLSISFEFRAPPGGQDEVVLSPDGSKHTIYLGGPIASITVPELLAAERAENLRTVLRHWIEIDRANIASVHAGVHWAVGPRGYETNGLPDVNAFQLAVFWNPKNLDTCIRNFARAAAALRLTLAAGGPVAEVSPAMIKSLNAALADWSAFLDPAAAGALRKLAMPSLP